MTGAVDLVIWDEDMASWRRLLEADSAGNVCVGEASCTPVDGAPPTAYISGNPVPLDSAPGTWTPISSWSMTKSDGRFAANFTIGPSLCLFLAFSPLVSNMAHSPRAQCGEHQTRAPPDCSSARSTRPPATCFRTRAKCVFFCFLSCLS